MQPVFEPIDLLRQDDYRRRLAACPQVSSDYSFINLWGWADAYGLEWSWEESLVWTRQTRPEPLMWAPVGDWNAVDWPRRLADSESGMRLTRVPAAR